MNKVSVNFLLYLSWYKYVFTNLGNTPRSGSDSSDSVIVDSLCICVYVCMYDVWIYILFLVGISSMNSKSSKVIISFG